MMLKAFDVLCSLLQRGRLAARRAMFCEQWMIGVVDEPIRNALAWTTVPKARWIAPLDFKRTLAEPFPWPGSDDTLLCTSYDTLTDKSGIAALKLDANGIAVEIAIHFPLPKDVSFPFLHMVDGVVYAMPDASSSGRLEIFRWREEDGSWVSHAVVFDNRPVVDAVLFQKDNLFWITYTEATENPYDNLYLIFAPSLQGPWRAHPSNPVRSGRESSRNGGAVFEVNGKRYRPAQDCTEACGSALRIMEIVTCTTKIYRESEVTRITSGSGPYPDGICSLAAWGDKCLVDGMRLTFAPRYLWAKVTRRLYERFPMLRYRK